MRNRCTRFVSAIADVRSAQVERADASGNRSNERIRRTARGIREMLERESSAVTVL
jgi:hypothetical protein